MASERCTSVNYSRIAIRGQPTTCRIHAPRLPGINNPRIYGILDRFVRKDAFIVDRIAPRLASPPAASRHYFNSVNRIDIINRYRPVFSLPNQPRWLVSLFNLLIGRFLFEYFEHGAPIRSVVLDFAFSRYWNSLGFIHILWRYTCLLRLISCVNFLRSRIGQNICIRSTKR